MSRRRSGNGGHLELTPQASSPSNKSQTRHTSRRVKTITWVVAAFLSMTALAAVVHVHFDIVPSLLPAGYHAESLPQKPERLFELHPQRHALRRPTVLEFDWTVSLGDRRPDGILKPVYLVNNAFPGPTIEARSGDRIVVRVKNALPNGDGLSLHWHGLGMRGANDQDGAAGITQSPIAVGATHVYNFTIDPAQAGTFWWHAHSAIQRADGLFGGLVVHKPAAAKSAWKGSAEWLLLAQDWYHRPAEEAIVAYGHPGAFGLETVPDSILLNGRGLYNCSNAVPARPLDCRKGDAASLPARRFDSGVSNLLRIINVGAYAGMSFSTRGAHMRPMALDGGHAVDAPPADSIGTLHPGERIDVLIHLNAADGGDHVIQLDLDEATFQWDHKSNKAQAADESSVTNHLDLQSLKALEGTQLDLPAAADRTFVLYAITQKLARLENVPHGFINNTFWPSQEAIALPLIKMSKERWSDRHFIPHVPYQRNAPLIVDVVLNNLDEESHPFHLHGYDFWVLSTHTSAYNWGSYNPYTDDDPPGGPYDLKQPLRKDTVVVPRRGYAVIRFQADNPGLWMFHCHVLWHLASGMAMASDIS